MPVPEVEIVPKKDRVRKRPPAMLSAEATARRASTRSSRLDTPLSPASAQSFNGVDALAPILKR